MIMSTKLTNTTTQRLTSTSTAATAIRTLTPTARRIRTAILTRTRRHLHLKKPLLFLLKYMLDHNRHHAEELHDLAHNFDEVAGDLIHEAVDKLGESNDLIEQALSLIQNQ